MPLAETKSLVEERRETTDEDGCAESPSAGTLPLSSDAVLPSSGSVQHEDPNVVERVRPHRGREAAQRKDGGASMRNRLD